MTAKKSAKQPKQPKSKKSKKDLSEQDLSSVSGALTIGGVHIADDPPAAAAGRNYSGVATASLLSRTLYRMTQALK